MNRRVTMADVAQRAGVHVTTVSLALRNHPSLPPCTRKRLQDLAKKMGYEPDPALSALVAYRHRTRPRVDRPILAYVTHWDTPWGWKASAAHSDFFDGATEKAALLGYQLEHFWLGEPGLTHRRLSGILYARGITGLIIASHRPDARTALDFDWSRFSAVKIDYSPPEPKLHLVTNDQSAIVRLAVQRVLAAGYRRIGFVMPRWWDEFVDLAWSAGFLTEQQRIPRVERIPILFYSTAAVPKNPPDEGPEYVISREALEKWLGVHQPEVLISRPLFVQSRLSELGLSIPGDLGLVDILLEKTDGAIAGVYQNCHRVGEIAVEILTGQLHQNVHGIPAIPTATYVEGTWFNGASLPERQPDRTGAVKRRGNAVLALSSSGGYSVGRKENHSTVRETINFKTRLSC